MLYLVVLWSIIYIYMYTYVGYMCTIMMWLILHPCVFKVRNTVHYNISRWQTGTPYLVNVLCYTIL
jgi:hypothetical protein